jgi:phage baseplate assembly protein W
MPVNGGSIIEFNPSGTSLQYLSPEEIVKQKILFILSVSKYEVPNDPAYGADLIQFVHMPLDDSLEAMIDTVVRAEIGLRMNFVLIRDVVLDRNKKLGGLRFTVYYELAEGFTDFVNVTIPEL